MGTPNVYAGMPNGSEGLNAAYKEISQAIAAIYQKDADGYVWGR